jgi:hypothetical protein
MLSAAERFAQIEARRAAREATARAQAGAHPAQVGVPVVEPALASAAEASPKHALRDAGAQAAAQQAAADQQAAAGQLLEARRAAREATARAQAGAHPAGQQAAARQQPAAGQPAATLEDVDDITGFDDDDDPEYADAGYTTGYAAGYLEGYADAKATEAEARADLKARLATAEASAAQLKSEHATMMHKLQNFIKDREAALESGAGSRGPGGRGRGPTAKRGHGGASAEAAPHAAGVGRAAGRAAGEAVPAPAKGKASASKKRSAAGAHTLIGPEDCGACGLPAMSDYRHECICGHLVHSSLFMCTEAGAENSTLITGEDSWYCSKKCKCIGSR